eukprot:TRINITY_DN3908_c0_g1_i1.p1 TRINITY_DN3908_c0_g1~~TRINITY_DN3908_c0_g1_i1.p1  ORF type:complete len:821 (-),score=150.37 TRINITY_DN3908_c0_g1_i1:129-2591(-)
MRARRGLRKGDGPDASAAIKAAEPAKPLIIEQDDGIDDSFFISQDDGCGLVRPRLNDMPLPVTKLLPRLEHVTVPDANAFRKLFMINNPNDHGEHVLPVCIPFYNEERSDLHRTLQSLKKRIREVYRKNAANIGKVYVMLVGDGYDKCSTSMKKYLCEIFNITKEDMMPASPTSFARIVTYSGEDKFGYSKFFQLTLVMKKHNAGKADSQEIFCKLFTTALSARYMLLTDCGTMYKNFCMVYLLEFMDEHPECVGATGHQRVMALADQETESTLHNNLFAYAQGFDYEASQSMFTTPFTIVGCLPVIPGPCGMFNFELLKECGALDDYFDLLRAAQDCKTPDLIMGNLVLAEDRILCFMAVSCSNFNYYTSIEPRAVFFFEAETDPLKLFQQRRRWLNGTEAGYIMTWRALRSRSGKIPALNNKTTESKDQYDGSTLKIRGDLSEHSDEDEDGDVADPMPGNYVKRFILLSFVTLQLLVHILMLFSVGIFTVALHFSLKQLFPDSPLSYDDALVLAYMGLNLVFVSFHYQKSGVRLHKPTVYALIILNAVVSVIVLVAYIMYLYMTLPTLSIHEHGIWVILTKLLPFFWFCGSLVLAASHGILSLLLWLQYFLFYMLMLPTMVSTLPLYALCRTWELSWGNRPSDSQVSDPNSQLDEIQYFYDAQRAFEIGEYQQCMSLLSSAKKYITNVGMDEKYLDRLDVYLDHVKKAMELQDKSNVVVFVVVMANVLLALMLVELENVASVVTMTTTIVFLPVVIFQAFAVLFWLYFFIGPRRMGCIPLFVQSGYRRLSDEKRSLDRDSLPSLDEDDSDDASSVEEA